MLKNYLSKFFFTLLAGLFISIPSEAQFNYNIYGETGIYNSSGKGLQNTGNLLASVEGTAGYKFFQNNRRASIQLRIRPELYGVTNDLRSLKFRASADYHQKENNFNWGINVIRQLFTFQNDNLNISYDQFLLIADVSGFFWNGSPISLNLGYAFQKFSSTGKQQLDMIFLNSQLYELINPFFKIGYGIYTEKFSIQNDLINLKHKINSNKGWRYGPEMSLNYLKNFILKFEYRFLFYDSQFTTYPSTEQWIRLVGGKIISKKWSIFLLVDYYYHSFKKTVNNNDNEYPLYTPTNFENRIYGKLGYDVSDKLEIYLKPGYFKENLFSDKYSFEGWDLLIGFEIGD